jgi:catalase (peroxidase I)
VEDHRSLSCKTVQMRLQPHLMNTDIVTLVTGSHTMGGAHSAISPHATNKTFAPFDTTPGVFDNDVFKQMLMGRCVLNIDCAIGKDPEMRDIVETFAKDQDAFFQQYAKSFNKMTTIGQRAKLAEVHVDISVHKNLESEGGIDPVKTSSGSCNGSWHKSLFTMFVVLFLFDL